VCLGCCALIGQTEGYVTVTPGPYWPEIDGILETAGLAIAKWLAGQIPIPVIGDLIDAIVNAWVVHEQKAHYWEHVEENVKQTCGQFINQKNIDQVLVYKDDVSRMLQTYKRAPVHGDGTYPDKNTVADAVTTSVISNRFLVEAALMPWSMTLHFVDIASVHVMILKDAAESYSVPGEAPSQWWKDLSHELGHYDNYSQALYNETIKFRESNIQCKLDKGLFHDTYTMTDHVTGKTGSCKQEHNSGSCSGACQNFQDAAIKVFNAWFNKFVGGPRATWQQLKQEADKKAFIASSKRTPWA